MSEPLVSVIIPTYQRAKLIGETLDTVFAQTYQNWEIVVVDDGSTDDTASVVANYGPRLRYFTQTNAGPSAARNHAVRMAQGEFLAFHDSDDLWTPEKLSQQMRLFAANPELGWVYCDMDYFGSEKYDGKPSSFHYFPPARGWILEHMLKFSTPMHTPTVVVRKSLFHTVGGYDESLRAVEDHDLYFRLAAEATVDYVPQVMVHCRRGTDRPLNKRYPGKHYRAYATPRLRALLEHPDVAQKLTLDQIKERCTVHLYEAIISAAQENDTAMVKQCLREIRQWEPRSLKTCYYTLAAYWPKLFLAIHRPEGHV